MRDALAAHLTRAKVPPGHATRLRTQPGAACESVALVLQGGGALGAYQVGAYDRQREANVEPDSHRQDGHADAATTPAHGPMLRLPAIDGHPAAYDLLTPPRTRSPLLLKEVSHEHAE